MKYHFIPQKGWINDPNGLVYADGKYHLFYQHYPNDTQWGPMHWGHAVSVDLLKWDHLPIALFPAEDEFCFSGSAIVDYRNVSGLGSVENPAMLLFYTSHNPKNGEQKQSLAYSTDYVNFQRYDKNPIIDNYVNQKRDFRDPKVVINSKTGGYTMVLAAGDRIEFYNSHNLLDWDYSGDFVPAVFDKEYICECPDLLQFEDKYVLTMSLVLPGEEEDHMMPYFIGDFNGEVFINTQSWEIDQFLDFGKDNYAMVSFSGTEEVIMLGWGEDWNKARENNRTDYFGKMTLPRRVFLIDKGDRLLLKQKPILTEEAAKDLVVFDEDDYLICREENYYEFFIKDGTISFSVNK